MKLLLVNIHLSSLAVAIGSMLIAEHLIYERVISARGKPFTPDIYDTVLLASHAVKFALLLLWLSGAGFVVLGYLDDPGYLENQKIWAKAAIVLLISLNGVYIHRTLLPRLREVSQGSPLIHDAKESAKFRLSFSTSIAGWLFAAFYGTAKFLNNGYQFRDLFAPYLAIVAALFLLSYLVRPERNEPYKPAAGHQHLRDG